MIHMFWDVLGSELVVHGRFPCRSYCQQEALVLKSNFQKHSLFGFDTHLYQIANAGYKKNTIGS